MFTNAFSHLGLLVVLWIVQHIFWGIEIQNSKLQSFLSYCCNQQWRMHDHPRCGGLQTFHTEISSRAPGKQLCCQHDPEKSSSDLHILVLFRLVVRIFLCVWSPVNRHFLSASTCKYDTLTVVFHKVVKICSHKVRSLDVDIHVCFQLFGLSFSVYNTLRSWLVWLFGIIGTEVESSKCKTEYRIIIIHRMPLNPINIIFVY